MMKPNLPIKQWSNQLPIHDWVDFYALRSFPTILLHDILPSLLEHLKTLKTPTTENHLLRLHEVHTNLSHHLHVLKPHKRKFVDCYCPD
mgnify:CR=1 FL=1